MRVISHKQSIIVKANRMKRSRAPSTQLIELPLASQTVAVKKYRPSKKRPKTAWKDICNAGLGFPKMLKMKHRYVETVVITSTSGVIGNYLFSCNGLYDPNISGTGHQPYYFDQVSALYRHYCVTGSKIKIRAQNTSGSDAAFQLALHVNDDTSIAGTSINQVSEQQTAKLQVFNAYNNSKTAYMTQSWNATKYFGRSPLANSELQGTSSANPTEQSYYAISVQAAGAATLSMNVTVEIEYDVIWKEVNDVATS